MTRPDNSASESDSSRSGASRSDPDRRAPGGHEPGRGPSRGRDGGPGTGGGSGKGGPGNGDSGNGGPGNGGPGNGGTRAGSAPDDTPERYAGRAYRSMPGVISGVLLLAITAWLVGDAVARGEGRTPWLALAALLMVVPVIVAFTVRPVVLADDDRMLVRNPFRTITLPWTTVETVRAGYSTEALAGGATYQLWAIPVSLRQRKRASRQQARAAAEDPFQRGGPGRRGAAPGTARPGRARAAGAAGADGPARAWADSAVEELRELAERNARREEAGGEVSVRWAVEVIVPALVGAAVLLVLSLTG